MNLKHYSAMLSVFLLAEDTANAQIAYVDIEPDIQIDKYSGAFELDIDLDGDSEFRFFFGYLSYFPGLSSWFIKERGPSLKALNYPEDAFEGIDYPTGAAIRAYAFDIEESGQINFSDSWIGNYGAFVCGREYWSFGWGSFFKYEIGFWKGEVFDKYLGIRFQDAENQTHYGWIRCDAPDSSRVLIIKDYAWQTKPDTPIAAGDTSITTSVEDAQSIIFSLYPNPAGNFITVRHYTSEILQLQIYDMAGQIVLTTQLMSSAEDIHIEHLAEGTYIVLLKNNQGLITGRRKFVKIKE